MIPLKVIYVSKVCPEDIYPDRYIFKVGWSNIILSDYGIELIDISLIYDTLRVIE